MTESFIALDVHCAFSEMAVVTGTGKFVTRDRCETAVPALVKMLSQVRRPRRLTFEEGPLADWLARELGTRVDELVVCEPRRNHWIAKDGDKDDDLDARKLADLFRGGYLKPVHQAGSLERSLLKQQVLLYHDRVRERVRQGNQLVSLWRRHGVFVKALTLLDEEEWRWQLTRLPVSTSLRRGLEQVRDVYGLLVAQETSLREELAGRARNIEAVRRFAELPGIGWIRGVTFYALIDTPHRFRSKAALWRYAGIGLERRHSGAGRRWKIRDLALFGSVLGEHFRPESDVDVLVTFEEEAGWSLLDVIAAEQELAELFGRPVDLVERATVEQSENWIRREHILKSAKTIYGR